MLFQACSNLCREIASEGFVLLENDKNLLPISPCRCAFFGPAQEKMRFYAEMKVRYGNSFYEEASDLCHEEES